MNLAKYVASFRFIISPFKLMGILLFGWIEKFNKNRIRLNKYYICTIIDNEAVLDNKPKWVYFNADSAKFLKYRQEAIDIIRNNYKDIKISTTTITLQKLLEKNGLKGEPTNKAIYSYREESYYLVLCNFHNWEKNLIKNRFKQISIGTPKKYFN